MKNAKHRKGTASRKPVSGKKDVLKIVAWVAYGLEAAALIGGIVYIVVALKLLPLKFILAISMAVLGLLFLQAVFMTMKKGKRALRITSLVLSVLMLLVSGVGGYYLETFRAHIGSTFNGDDTVNAPEVHDITNTPFLVYVSGLDQTGAINDSGNPVQPEINGRSDVNILIAVNPNTKKVLMVHIPRDYYVPLMNDPAQMDKLTHAGNKGIEWSMKTVDAVFGLESNYYLKVNFNSVVDVVDVLGGITVNCQIHDFSSSYSLSGQTYYFKHGENQLTGDSALAYARERYRTGGDGQRGKHQQQVISAILDKVMSPAILSNFGGFFASVSKNFRTNMSYDEMASLVRMQLDDMAEWEFDSISVEGQGGYRPCWMLGGANAYVMIPGEQSVADAAYAIKCVMYPEQYTTTTEPTDGTTVATQ